MNRREFIGWISIGSIASSLPVAIAACSSGTTQTPSSPVSQAAAPRSDGFRAIGTIAELDQAGQLLKQSSGEAPVLVIRNPEDKQQLMAVNPVCTHRGCTVQWQASDKVFVCPCHSAKFSPDGKVLKKPASEPLPVYHVKIEQGNILVAMDDQPGKNANS